MNQSRCEKLREAHTSKSVQTSAEAILNVRRATQTRPTRRPFTYEGGEMREGREQTAWSLRPLAQDTSRKVTVGKSVECHEFRHVRGSRVALTSTIMSTAEDDYEKLSKEEREARDKADREKEAAEQAGIYFFLSPLQCRRFRSMIIYCQPLSFAIYMETAARRH